MLTVLWAGKQGTDSRRCSRSQIFNVVVISQAPVFEKAVVPFEFSPLTKQPITIMANTIKDKNVGGSPPVEGTNKIDSNDRSITHSNSNESISSNNEESSNGASPSRSNQDRRYSLPVEGSNQDDSDKFRNNKSGSVLSSNSDTTVEESSDNSPSGANQESRSSSDGSISGDEFTDERSSFYVQEDVDQETISFGDLYGLRDNPLFRKVVSSDGQINGARLSTKYPNYDGDLDLSSAHRDDLAQEVERLSIQIVGLKNQLKATKTNHNAFLRKNARAPSSPDSACDSTGTGESIVTLGKGGSGKVYRTTGDIDMQPVAVKEIVVKAQTEVMLFQKIAEAEQEAKLHASIPCHTNIVRYNQVMTFTAYPTDHKPIKENGRLAPLQEGNCYETPLKSAQWSESESDESESGKEDSRSKEEDQLEEDEGKEYTRKAGFPSVSPLRSSPQSVAIREDALWEGKVMIAMELCNGGSLDRKILARKEKKVANNECSVCWAYFWMLFSVLNFCTNVTFSIGT